MTTPLRLQLSIGARLTAGFAIVIGLFLAAVALAVGQHGAVQANLERVNTQYFPNMVLADTVVNTAGANVRSTLEVLLSADAGRTDSHVGDIAADRALRAEALRKLTDAPQTDAGRQAVAALTGLNERTNAALDTVLQALRAGNTDDARQRAATTLMPASDALVAAARALSESYDRGIDAYTDASIEATHAASTIIAVAAALAALVGAALAFWLVRSITRPLATAVAAARQLSAGNTAMALRIDQHDEVGELLRAMQHLADGLAGIAATAQQVAQGDLEAEVVPRGEHDSLAQAFGGLLATMRALLAVTDHLCTAAREGRLEERGDVAQFEGAFATLVDGFNHTLDAMVQPINAAGEALDALAGRDLTAQVAGDYRGDYARVQQAINGATHSLNQALLTAAEGAQQVAAASVELAAGAQSTAQGASEQAATLEQVAASLQEVHSMARTSSGAASQANTLADNHRSLTLQSVDHMRRANVAMERIKEASDATARIVRTIDEFAFQTNLLALNAAVEAARAGDAGRSFAVVAEEVRELALRSAAAARSTAQLIDESAVRTAEGVACNQGALAALEEMAGCVDELNGALTEIVEAAEHQDLAVEQINMAIDQLNQVTQHSAATAEESAAAAQELAHQAGQMLAVVETFTLQQPEDGDATLGGAADRQALRLVAV